MPVPGQHVSDRDINSAGKQGLKGAINGAASYGAATLLLSLVAYQFSPVYRRLTFQFKVFLQMSGMTLGAVIEADRRFRDAERLNRRVRTKARRDAAVWRTYEEEFEKQKRDSGGDGHVGGGGEGDSGGGGG